MTPDQATYTLHTGSTPLLVSLPHAGTQIPAQLHARYQPWALNVPDTDWHLPQVYAFARTLGASVIAPVYSRYVIDLNRPPENTPMYPGANNTELCPTRAFTGEPIYRPGQAPDEAEIAARVSAYWLPYHDALAAELARLRATHGYALLWDGHSIYSTLPWLFDGRLPDLNMGTAQGTSCDASLRAALMSTLAHEATTQQLTQVTDGRFKGGYITRHYGRPTERVHAVQMEMAFDTYMDEALMPTRPDQAWPDAASAQAARDATGQVSSYQLDAARCARLQPVLQALLSTMLSWRPQ